MLNFDEVLDHNRYYPDQRLWRVRHGTKFLGEIYLLVLLGIAKFDGAGDRFLYADELIDIANFMASLKNST